MLLKNRKIIDDLNMYLTEGIDSVNGTPTNFDTTYKQYYSQVLHDVAFKYILKYEDCETLPDDGTTKVIPVLIIQNVDIQKGKKQLIYHNHLIDIATLFSDPPSTYPTCKIRFYVVPFISGSSNNIIGTLNYTVHIDYDTEYDIYGLMGKEINQTIMNHYYRYRNTEHYNIITSNYQMYFVPNRINFIDNTNTRFHRIIQEYNIKVCTVK